MMSMFEGLSLQRLTFRGVEREVFVGGEGPPVVVMHEIPGLHPAVVAFAQRLVARGFMVWLPSLFGEVGRPPSPTYGARSIARACVSREFTVWALGRSSPVVAWLRELSAHAHAQTGQPVGAVGMCLTGGYALAMAVDDHLAAPVLSQPSCPFAFTPGRARAVDASDEELQRVVDRGVCVLGLRFTGDVMVPAARFRALRQRLGDRFEAVEIPSGRGTGIPRFAHSVLAHDFVDEPGHPTVAALERVVAFFDEQLRGPGACHTG